MSFLIGFLSVLSVLIAIALILIVVIQNSKGGGLSSTFGASGAAQMLGARRSSEYIEKLTWWLAGALAIIAFTANVVGTSSSTEQQLRMRRSIEEGSQYIEQPTQILSPDAYEAPGSELEATPEE